MLDYTVPFDFDGTVCSPDHFSRRDMHWEPGLQTPSRIAILIGYRVSGCSSWRLQAIQT